MKELAKIEQGLKALDDKKAEEDYKDATVFKRSKLLKFKDELKQKVQFAI